MKTYALMREQDRIRPGDADTGEMHPKSPVPGPVPQHAPSANPAVQLRDAVRARRQELEILRSAMDTADAARARAEEPQTPSGPAEGGSTAEVRPDIPSLPIPDLDRLSLAELLVLRPDLQAPEPQVAEDVAEGPQPADPEARETPREIEEIPETPQAPEPKPEQQSEEEEPTTDKVSTPRSPQVLGQVAPGTNPRIPGPLVFEIHPPAPAGETYQPADTPPEEDETDSGNAAPEPPMFATQAPTAVQRGEVPEPEVEEHEIEGTEQRAKTPTQRAEPQLPAETTATEKAAAGMRKKGIGEKEEGDGKPTDEEVAAEEAERAKGVDPDAPADEPSDRTGIEDLELTEETPESAPGKPAGGATSGAARDLEAWKTRADKAASDIDMPDLGPLAEKTSGMRAQGKAATGAGQKRREAIAKEAQSVFKVSQRSIKEIGQVPETFKQDAISESAVEAIKKNTNKALDKQQLPLLRPTPKGTLPNLYGDPISKSDLDALKKIYLPPKEKRGKNFDEMSELLKRFKHDLETNEDLKGRIAVFEGQVIDDRYLPPKLEIAPVHKADVAAILARIVTESEELPKQWIDDARDRAYQKKSLSKPNAFPSLGKDWVPQEASLLRAEMQRVRDKADISKEQLDEAIKQRLETLKGGSEAIKQLGDKVYEDEKDKVRADYETTRGVIQGLQNEWEGWLDETASRKAGVDPKAVRARQHEIERVVQDMANEWLVAYDEMRKGRRQKLIQAKDEQQKAYKAAIDSDKKLDLQEAGDDEAAKKQLEPRHKEYDAFLKNQIAEIGRVINGFDRDNARKIEAWQKALRAERKRILKKLRDWGDGEIGRTRSWISETLASIYSWRDQEKREARAFAAQRAGETVAFTGGQLQALHNQRANLDELGATERKKKIAQLGEEQRAVLNAYYGYGKGPAGDAIGAVAEGLKLRLRAQRLPRIIDAMKKRVMATSNNSPEGLKVGGLADYLGEHVSYAARQLKTAFEVWDGTDETAIWDALGEVESAIGAKGVRAFYFSMANEDLDTRLKSELAGGWPDSEGEYDKAQSMLMKDDPEKAKATLAVAEIKIAVDGWGTDVNKVKEALRRYPPNERKKIVKLYDSKYGENLEDRLKGELWGRDEDVGIALLHGKDDEADAIEVRQGQYSAWGQQADIEAVYKRIRKEEYDRAGDEDRKNLGKYPDRPGITSAEVEKRIKKRIASLGEAYEKEFDIDLETSLRQTFYAEPPVADLLIGLQKQDFEAVDSARLEIERRSLYADDEVINQKVLKIQHDRALQRYAFEADIQLNREEHAYLESNPGVGPMLAEDRLKRKEQLMQAASNKALIDASKTLAGLKAHYMQKYGQHYPSFMGGGTTDPAAFDEVIRNLTQGAGEDEAVERLKGDGYLEPHREVHYAIERDDKQALKALFQGKSKAWINAVQEKYEKHPGTRAKRKMPDAVLGIFSGREKKDLEITLNHGEPTDPATALKIAEEKLAYEKATGGDRPVGERASFQHLRYLVDRLREEKREFEVAQADEDLSRVIVDEATGARYYANAEMGAFQSSWQNTFADVNRTVNVHRREVDAETELIAGIVGMVAAVVATVVAAVLVPFTGGASLGLILLAAALIAGTGTAATMATKQYLKGDAYSKDEIAMDLAFGVVDFVITALTLGAGKFVGPALRGGLAAANAGKTTVKEGVKQLLKGTVTKGVKRTAQNQAMTELAQGVFSTVAIPSIMEEYGEGMNPLASTLVSLGLGLVGGGVIGAGANRLHNLRAADFDFQAHAKSTGDSGDLIELRGNPGKLKGMQDAYLADNPHRTASDFLKDYDDILLKMMKGKDFKAKWQKSARRDLLQDISDPKVKQQLAETPVDLISDKEFLRLTGSKKGYAVVIIKDGVPTVVLRQGAPASALRQEGQHLLQAVQKKWKGHMEMLDETKLRDWKVKDAREKLVAYDAKLDLEVDANERYLDVLRRQSKQPDAPAHLGAEIARIEQTITNLLRRKLEVARIGPLRRTLMGWGSIFEPQYLRQRPRLFAKKTAPSATPRRRPSAAGGPEEVPRERVILEPYSGPKLNSAEDLARNNLDARVIATEGNIKPSVATPGSLETQRRFEAAGGEFIPEHKPASIPPGSVDEIKMRFPIPHERAIEQDFLRHLADLETRFPDRSRAALLAEAQAITLRSAETVTTYAPYALQRLKKGGKMEIVFREREIADELKKLTELRFFDLATGKAYRFELEAVVHLPKGEIAPFSGFGLKNVTNETPVGVGRLRKVELSDAEVRSSEFLAQRRYDPKRLTAMQEEYLKANPGRTADDFLRDFDALLLKQMDDAEVRAKWQQQAREDMLKYVPKQQKARLADIPVELMDDGKFFNLTGSETGQAVVMIKDGQPTVVVRQGASPTALRREAPHLLQALDEKWAGHFKRLDEANLADWPRKDIREKFGLYKDKLEIEIDAAEADLALLRDLAKKADPPPGIAREVAGLEETLRNLGRRRAEVEGIGPIKRTLMAWKLWPEPQYLKQKPRLFSKRTKTTRPERLPSPRELQRLYQKLRDGTLAPEEIEQLQDLHQAVHAGNLSPADFGQLLDLRSQPLTTPTIIQPGIMQPGGLILPQGNLVTGTGTGLILPEAFFTMANRSLSQLRGPKKTIVDFGPAHRKQVILSGGHAPETLLRLSAKQINDLYERVQERMRDPTISTRRADILELGAGWGTYSKQLSIEFAPQGQKSLATDIASEPGSSGFLLHAERAGIDIRFGVDANKIDKVFAPDQLSKIIAVNPYGLGKNWPGASYGLLRYAGTPTGELDALRNMIHTGKTEVDTRFLQAAHTVLKPGGQIVLRAKSNIHAVLARKVFRDDTAALTQLVHDNNLRLQLKPVDLPGYIGGPNPYITSKVPALRKFARLGYRIEIKLARAPNQDVAFGRPDSGTKSGVGKATADQADAQLNPFNTEIVFTKSETPSITIDYTDPHGSGSPETRTIDVTPDG